MRAYQCDRCGEFYGYFSKGKSEEIFITSSNASTGCIKDLCSKCQDELEAWWTKNKKKKEKEAHDGTN